MEVVIMGAGPAGLTAAFEILKAGKEKRPRARVTVIEETDEVGGIAVTKRHKDYRFDIGGHRFFTKNGEVRRLWRELMGDDLITCKRLSRIYYKGKMFSYPLKPVDMLSTLSLPECFSVTASYAASRVSPRPARSFEDWVCNQFGRKLFELFFESYTEKVWGMPCAQISSDWAGQRIKGVSFASAVKNAFNKGSGSVKSLIEQFEYPVLGPGMLWERLRDKLEQGGVRFLMGCKVQRLRHRGGRIFSAEVMRAPGQGGEQVEGDVFLSSIPLRELVEGLSPPADQRARDAAGRLKYRDFIIVALVVRKKDLFPDNWIYIQVPEVAVGRIQNFKNWSRAMVPDPEKTCLGMEYFSFEGDRLWESGDRELVSLASRELARLGFASEEDIEEGVPIRMKKAYPVYTLDYKDHVGEIRRCLSGFTNLQVMGRNGLHRYNNMDHSMVTAMLAARNAMGADYDVFKVNEDACYHEESRN